MYKKKQLKYDIIKIYYIIIFTIFYLIYMNII